MASFLRGKQAGIQNDLSQGITPDMIQLDDFARYGINSQISALAYDPVQSLLAVGTNDSKFGPGLVYVFGQARVCINLRPPRRASIRQLQFCADKLIVFDNKNDVTIFALDTGAQIANYAPPGHVTAIATDPNIDYVLMGMQNGEVMAYDLDREGMTPFRIPNLCKEMHPRSGGPVSRILPVVCLQFHPKDIGTLLIGYSEGAVVYSFKQNKALKAFHYRVPRGAPGGGGRRPGGPPASAVMDERTPRLTHALWHPTGTFVLTAHDDGSLVFWDPKDGRLVHARSVEKVDVNVPGTGGGSSAVPPKSPTMPLSPTGPSVQELYSRLAWCSKENPDDTGLLIGGGASKTALTFIDLGPTPIYQTSNWQQLATYFRNPKSVHSLPTPPGAAVVDYLLIPRTTPHYAGAHDPIAILAILGSGELLTMTFPSGHPISPTNQLPVHLAFISPFVTKIALAYVPRTRWLGLRELRQQGPKFVMGGAEGNRPLKRYEHRNVVQTAHADGTIRVWDAGHGDTIENGTVIQADLGRAVGRWDNLEVTQMSLSGAAGELSVGLRSGEVVVFRFSRNASAGRPAADTDKNAAPGQMTDISKRTDPGLKEGLIPITLTNEQQGAVTALKHSDVGFVAAGYASGSITMVDMRGPAIIYTALLSELSGGKSGHSKRASTLGSSHRARSDSRSGAGEYATVMEYGVLTLEGDSYSSILLFVGTSKGRVATFKILPSQGGRYSAQFAGITSLTDDRVVSLFPMECRTGESAHASGPAVAGLQSGRQIDGVLVATTMSSAHIFKPPQGKGASKTFDGAFCDSASVVTYEGRGSHALAGLFGDGTARVYSLPGLKAISSQRINHVLDTSRFAEAIVSPTADILGWTGPSEIALVNTLGTGLPLPPSPDRVFDPAKVIPPRPTISNLQWISGTQFITPADLDLLIGGPDRPPSKRMLSEMRAQQEADFKRQRELARSGRAGSGSSSQAQAQAGRQPQTYREYQQQFETPQQEGYWAYMQRQIQERTEQLGLAESSMDRAAEDSQSWSEDVSRFVARQKRQAALGFLGSKMASPLLPARTPPIHFRRADEQRTAAGSAIHSPQSQIGWVQSLRAMTVSRPQRQEQQTKGRNSRPKARTADQGQEQQTKGKSKSSQEQAKGKSCQEQTKGKSLQGQHLPPPPPVPHPSALPPGTTYGIPGGWQQSWGRPAPQSLPPPPPIQQNQYPYGAPMRQPSQINIPPPPPQNDKPLLSATFIPTGDSFGPGVGIPPLYDLSFFSGYGSFMVTEPSRSTVPEPKHSDGTYNLHSYSYPNPAQANDTIANREVRAASASSKAPPPFALQKIDLGEPVSPGPPTATRIPSHGVGGSSPGRQRAQSATVASNASNSLAQQWPLDRVLAWLSANDFSRDWQDVFRRLKLEGADFLDLGRGPNRRGNLGKMHHTIYPELTRVCSQNHTPWDQSREREEGKRLRKLVSRLSEGSDPGSASSGHRRRESGLIPSASTDGTLENSPHLTQVEFSGDISPGKQVVSQLGSRNSQGRSSTLPVFTRHSSQASTPSEGRPPDSLHGPQRENYPRGTLPGISSRGRHSPHLSGDALAPQKIDNSPSSSPGLGHAQPSSAGSGYSRPDHSKNNSIELMQKRTMPDTMNPSDVNSVRFYEQQRPNVADSHRTYSNESMPSASAKEGKGFLSKWIKKRHDQSREPMDEHGPESPTSPSLRSTLPRGNANASDPYLSHLSTSTSVTEGDRPSGTAKHVPRPSRKFVFITPDHWNYRLVDVGVAENAFALRRLLCGELGLVDFTTAQLFYTEPGQSDHDTPLTDDMLLQAQSKADSLGTTKIYVQSGPMSATAVPLPNGNHTAMYSSQQATGSQPILKSDSASGTVATSEIRQSPQELLKAAEEYRRQTEAKQRAYLEQRQNRKDSARNNFIDFDTPRSSPYEDRKSDSLMPVRRPPAAPSESNTLTKVNSLRTKTGSGNRASLDLLKRLSNPIVEDVQDNNKKRGSASSHATGIAAALVNVGKMAGAPATLSQDHSSALRSVDAPGGTSPGSFARPRPSLTWSKGNVLFNVPDYADSAGQPGFKNPAPQKQRPDPSPALSSSLAERPTRPALESRASYGPVFEFKELNIPFAPSPRPPQDHESDDDSDDGLFAIPLSNKSIPKPSERPTLTVNTDHTRKPTVAFKSPASSSGGVSLQRQSADESTTEQSGGGYGDRNYSDGSYSSSARSPDDHQRDSFVSEIWASRPAVENVVEKLDKYFPGVDLDKPFMEERADITSLASQADPAPRDRMTQNLGGPVTYGTHGLALDFTRKNDSDTLGSDESTLKAKDQNAIASVAQRQVGKAGGLGRMKSIREVALRRNDIQRGPSVSARVQAAQASSIVRRKSTKMFGANIVQIKPRPGNRLSTLDPIPQEDIPSTQAPTRQDTFKIIRGQLIGKGTYGRVYLGMNATTGEFLAVKQVEISQKVSGQDRERVKEMVKALDLEIDTMKDLEHPNIVQYLGCERKEFSISIYLEYISGGSIGSCLRKHGKFEESVVRSLTRQTLEGLAYLHDQGILHRDLKADNILLDLDGSCKISDFGISKRSRDIYANDVTNSMQGSVFWMAPEVVRSQGQGYSAKIDIWSLGCVVLEMFAGKRPWSREEAIGAIFKLGNLNQAPPIPEDVSATATVDGLNFMYDCFQINPHERPTAEILLQHSTFCTKDPHYNFYDTHTMDLDKCFTCARDFAVAESRFNVSTYDDLIQETKLQALLDVQKLSARRDAVEVAQIARARIARLRARRNGEVERVWRRFAARWEGAVREDNGRKLSVLLLNGSGGDGEVQGVAMAVPMLVWTDGRGRVVVEETVNLR
ncbi:hypothetical protein DV737_g5555, partial [Chaetothyriales sp. CBS 132003]